jgi:DNA (cytosine-5)-methyltransferase 1
MVFDEVCVELENLGYQVAPVVIPACAVNAPHKRERIWFVAYSIDNRHNPERNEASEKNGISGKHREEMDTREFDRTIISRDVTNTNRDGFEQRRGHDGIGQNVDGGNTSFEWATNSKDIDGCNTNGISEKQSTVGPRISEQTNDEKNKFTTTKGICRLDQRHNEFKGIITIDKCKIINSGTLVQKGFKRIQSPKHRGMAKDCRDISSYGTNECKNDGTIINRMDGDVANTNGNGFNERNGNNEINTSEGREYALGDINTSNVNGNTANTKSNGRKNALENRELERGRFRKSHKRNAWDSFPSVSPICNGDDGLSNRLDSITFPKWRNESIKAGGNAIVPQVVYQIFKAIKEYEALK